MNTVNSKTEIWTIGGGKGGVGKSFIISSIGNYLALQGKKVILIDADLGGANIHTFLGTSKPKVSLTEFFEDKIPLSELLVDSGIQNLKLLVGAVRSLAPDNIKHTQKQKFLRHIKNLNADYVLIDLGAGTHFNTIDTYLIADKMLVVIVPEIISIENMYYFLKNAFFRSLMIAFTEYGIKDKLIALWKNRSRYGIKNLKDLIEYLKTAEDPVPEIISCQLSQFSIYIILNQIRNNQEIMLGNTVKSICMKYFGFQAHYVGYVEYDNFIPRCINKSQPFMQTYPAVRCAKEIESVAENLIHGRHMSPVRNSAIRHQSEYTAEVN